MHAPLASHLITTLPLVAPEIFLSLAAERSGEPHATCRAMLTKSSNVRSTLLRIQRNNAENSKKFTEAFEAFLIALALTSPA
jgi:hypothetical protein